MYESPVALSVADPDLELRKEGPVLIYLPCWLFSFLSFLLFLSKITWRDTPRSARQTPPLDPPLLVHHTPNKLVNSE